MTKFTFVSAIAALMTISAVAQNRLVIPQIANGHAFRLIKEQRFTSEPNCCTWWWRTPKAYSDDFSQPNDTTS